MEADGGGVTNLSDDPAYDLQPAWSPDSGRIAYATVKDEQRLLDSEDDLQRLLDALS